MVSRGTRQRTSRITVPRRKFVWARRRITAAAIGASATSWSDLLVDFQTALGADLMGATIMRIRGEINWDSNLGVVAARIHYGPFADLSTGEGPGSRPYDDWMMYQPFLQRADTTGALSTRAIDVKASRKLDELGGTLVLGIEDGAAAASTFDADLSIGIKLP